MKGSFSNCFQTVKTGETLMERQEILLPTIQYQPYQTVKNFAKPVYHTMSNHTRPNQFSQTHITKPDKDCCQICNTNYKVAMEQYCKIRNLIFQTNCTRHGRQSDRGNSLESPSISLCSEVTIDRPPSPLQRKENFCDIFGNVDKKFNVDECLI